MSSSCLIRMVNNDFSPILTHRFIVFSFFSPKTADILSSLCMFFFHTQVSGHYLVIRFQIKHFDTEQVLYSSLPEPSCDDLFILLETDDCMTCIPVTLHEALIII